MTVNMTFVIEPTDKKFESHHWSRCLLSRNIYSVNIRCL